MRITTLPTPTTDISSLATASALATVDANVDAIKAVTDTLTNKSLQCDVLTGSSGTWTNPGVESVYLLMIGDGGGGAAGSYYNWAGTFYGAEGGGGGEFFAGWIPVTGNQAYTIGQGGTGGTASNSNPSQDGGNGDGCTFGDIYVEGGIGGRGANTVALNPGADGGGQWSGGYRSIGPSSRVANSGSGSSVAGGDGAVSPLTGDGGGIGSGGNTVPSQPTHPGAGGGAGNSADNSPSGDSNGGPGAKGYIAVMYYA